MGLAAFVTNLIMTSPWSGWSVGFVTNSGHHLFQTGHGLHESGHWPFKTSRLLIKTETEMKLVIEKIKMLKKISNMVMLNWSRVTKLVTKPTGQAGHGLALTRLITKVSRSDDITMRYHNKFTRKRTPWYMDESFEAHFIFEPVSVETLRSRFHSSRVETSI
jgi:hypothetical protein